MTPSDSQQPDPQNTSQQPAENEVWKRNKEIGATVRDYRKLNGSTLEACAKRIGRKKSYMQYAETGNSYLHAAELVILMEYLDIPRSAILPGSPQEEWPGMARIIKQVRSEDGNLLITIEVNMG